MRQLLALGTWKFDVAVCAAHAASLLACSKASKLSAEVNCIRQHTSAYAHEPVAVCAAHAASLYLSSWATNLRVFGIFVLVKRVN